MFDDEEGTGVAEDLRVLVEEGTCLAEEDTWLAG